MADWITSKEQVPNASTESLERAILTSDGGGVALKKAALAELLARATAYGRLTPAAVPAQSQP